MGKDFKTGEVDLASDIDVIQKSGAWFAYNGEKDWSRP